MINYIFAFAFIYVFFNQFEKFQEQYSAISKRKHVPGRVETALLNDSYTRDDYSQTARAFNADPTEVMEKIFPTIGPALFGDDLQYAKPSVDFSSLYGGTEQLKIWSAVQLVPPPQITPSDYNLF